MTTLARRHSFVAALLLAGTLVACSSDDDSGGGGTSGAAGSGATSGTGGSGGSSSGGSAGAATGGSAGASGKSCADLGAPSCFSNYDCPNGSERCQNIGSEQSPDVCCVPGSRGTKSAGEACGADTDCKSAICIDALCSDVCTGVASCPANMQDCKPIAFSGSPDMWCFPTP